MDGLQHLMTVVTMVRDLTSMAVMPHSIGLAWILDTTIAIEYVRNTYKKEDFLRIAKNPDLLDEEAGKSARALADLCTEEKAKFFNALWLNTKGATKEQVDAYFIAEKDAIFARAKAAVLWLCEMRDEISRAKGEDDQIRDLGEKFMASIEEKMDEFIRKQKKSRES